MNSKVGNSHLWQTETLEEIKQILQVTAHWMAIPLFALFWVADILYVPELKWQFLAIRILIVPMCLITTYFIKKTNSLFHAQTAACLYAIGLAFGINLMIIQISDPATGYYAGLNLVAIGCLSFIPFNKKFYVLTAAGIYLPYYLIMLLRVQNLDEWKAVGINSFFIFSSICICFLIRFFHDSIRKKEIMAKIDLQHEILSREEVIRTKTDEAVRLNSLYSQFSPQIVESIKNGQLNLDVGGQRAQVCAIFIDIVNSTERVTRIDKEKVEAVLSKFLDDTIRILLKYDITIDKFLGDGILAFCNAPVKKTDYVSRVVSAALEIREKIDLDQNYYTRHWQAPLEIRVGIAKGFVNVGFYGSKKYFRSYTAIGPVINLASRLCGSAEANQIVTDADVFDEVQNDFNTKFLGSKTLKGFTADTIFVYEIEGARSNSIGISTGVNDCPNCGGLLTLEANEKGQFELICKPCNLPLSLSEFAA